MAVYVESVVNISGKPTTITLAHVPRVNNVTVKI